MDRKTSCSMQVGHTANNTVQPIPLVRVGTLLLRNAVIQSRVYNGYFESFSRLMDMLWQVETQRAELGRQSKLSGITMWMGMGVRTRGRARGESSPKPRVKWNLPGRVMIPSQTKWGGM